MPVFKNASDSALNKINLRSRGVPAMVKHSVVSEEKRTVFRLARKSNPAPSMKISMPPAIEAYCI